MSRSLLKPRSIRLESVVVISLKSVAQMA
jgi:hypothetical protein